jgi:NDP-sugar pyrophosphorylase family protein
MIPVAILCGGKGTRIAALSGELPKALLPVADVPFLEHQLRWLARSGATDVVLLTGYRGERIRAFAGDGERFGLRVAYSDDDDRPRGTGGAVIRALPLLGDAFLTVYGDALLAASPAAAAAALRAPYEGVMTVYPNHDRWERSNVRVAGERVAVYDKQAQMGTMTHIDYGLNAFRSAAFAGFPTDAPVDLGEVHRALAARGTLRALTVSERWHEIGSPEGLAETERFLRHS